MKARFRVLRVTWNDLALEVQCDVYQDTPPNPTTVSIKRITNLTAQRIKYDMAAIEELCHDELESEE